MEGTIIALYLIKSVMYCSITNLFKDFLLCYYMMAQILASILILIYRDKAVIDDVYHEEKHEDTIPPPSHDQELTIDDAEVIAKNLGMLGWSDGEWTKEEGWMEGVSELLEEKAASVEELKEAFYVFDRNEDGFISPSELWNVLRRLGMKEGVRMEDCERMIRAFDEDGDGRVDFLEFKRLLENAM